MHLFKYVYTYLSKDILDNCNKYAKYVWICPLHVSKWMHQRILWNPLFQCIATTPRSSALSSVRKSVNRKTSWDRVGIWICSSLVTWSKTTIREVSRLTQQIFGYVDVCMIEGSLEVKLPTIWRDGKAEVRRVREERPRSEKIREEKEWEERRRRCAKR